MAVGLPTHQVTWGVGLTLIRFAETVEGVRASASGLVTAKDGIDALTFEEDEIGRGAEVAVTEHHRARFERRAKFLEEALFMIMKVADAIAAHRAGGQRHEGDQAQHGKAAAGL